ncbi:MAG TPA: sulfotransferase [Actinomycetota bacterium]|nr:sulfotransferase [Actinomycetota bacterium]
MSSSIEGRRGTAIDIDPTSLASERPIFVLASGHRTGSTLLQRLLNSCEQVMIWGEQLGYLNTFVQGYGLLRRWESQFAAHRRRFVSEGFDDFLPNMMPTDVEIQNAARLHLYGLFALPAARLERPMWGFKEVRYGVDVAVFLQSCFAGARFIHLTRDIVECFLSLKRWEDSSDDWTRSWTDRSLRHWEEINAGFLERGGELEDLLTVRYEDMVARPEAFVEDLSRFLGVSPGTFDTTVFDRVRTYNPADAGPRPDRGELAPEERDLLRSQRIAEVAAAYGYDSTF